jgi:hypothetical protein
VPIYNWDMGIIPVLRRLRSALVRDGDEGRGRLPPRLLSGLILAITVLFAVAVIAMTADYLDAKSRLSRFTLERYIEGNPVFVFKTVRFQKFLAAGTTDSASSRFERLSVLSVRGTAEFRASLANLAVDGKATSIAERSLVLTLPGRDLLEVEVKIPQGSVDSLYAVTGRAMGAGEAAARAEPIALISGALAAWAGAKAASSANPIIALHGSPIGGILGGAVGALAAGGGTYLFTKNYAVRVLSGLKAGAPSFGSETAVIDASRELIACELVGGQGSDSSSWEAETASYFAKELERRLAASFRGSGWKNVRLRTR